MNVLVLVGTTAFDSLVSLLDKPYANMKLDFQTCDSKYTCEYHRQFDFIQNIEDTFDDYDLIVTHAGAGTVYKLLESTIPFLVVPNTERADKHQLELARFVEDNGYTRTASTEQLRALDIEMFFLEVISFRRRRYSKELFFMKDFILQF